MRSVLPVAPLVLLGTLAAACGGPVAGDACPESGDCGARLVCVPVEGRGSLCMTPCDADTWLCADGAVCLESPSSGRVCWFGGGTPLGASCVEGGDLGCEPGTVCAADGRCAQACDLEAPSYLTNPLDFDPSSVCESTERCESIAGGVEGVCVTISDGVDADAGVTSP